MRSEFVALNLEFNTHLNISKLLSLSLLLYKTNDLFFFVFLFLFFFNIPINMYSKDPKNVGRVILNAGETRTGTVHLKCVWSCLQMLFFLFVCLGFFCTSISCIGVIPCRHLCCLDTQYVMDAGKLFFFFFFVLLFVCTRPHKCFSLSQLRSLLPLQTFCVFAFKSSCGHQIQILMARHPFKNPLKALVTFRTTCFCVFF